jgi:hypothetical protein
MRVAVAIAEAVSSGARTPAVVPEAVVLDVEQHAFGRPVQQSAQLVAVCMTPVRPWLRMRIDHPRLAWLGSSIHWKPRGEEGSVVVSELKPKLLLDPVKLRVGEARVDRAHGSESQPTHGLLTETTAIFTALIKPCPHAAGLYLAGLSQPHQFRGARPQPFTSATIRRRRSRAVTSRTRNRAAARSAAEQCARAVADRGYRWQGHVTGRCARQYLPVLCIILLG